MEKLSIHIFVFLEHHLVASGTVRPKETRLLGRLGKGLRGGVRGGEVKEGKTRARLARRKDAPRDAEGEKEKRAEG